MATTDTQHPSARTNSAYELEQLYAFLYTPMTREEWERNMEIYNNLLDYVFGVNKQTKNTEDEKTI